MTPLRNFRKIICGLNRKEQKPWPYRKRCFRERMILTS